MSLTWRFLVIATVAMVCAIATVLVTTTAGFGRQYEAALQSRALAIGQGLQSQLERLLLLGIRVDGLTGFDEQCRHVVRAYPGIDSALVLDRSGRVLFHSAEGARPTVATGGLLEVAQQGRQAVLVQADGHHIAVPGHDEKGEVVASIVVSIDAELMQSELRVSLHSALAVGVLVGLASIALLNGSLAMFVKRPLDSLMGTMARLRQDPTDHRLRARLTSGDELGQLGRAFNELIDELQRSTVSRAALEAALSELQQTSDDLFAQKERAEVTLRSIADGVVVVDAEGRIGYANPAARQLVRWHGDDPAGRPVAELLGLVDSASGQPVALDAAHDGETDLLRHDGSRIGVDWRAAQIHDRLGQTVGNVFTFRDVSAERAHDQQRRWEAAHDVLTGLANRREFEALAGCRLGRLPGRQQVACGLLPGPGPLQGGQRHLRPCRRRRPAAPGVAGAALTRARDRHRGPAGRRRVCAAAA